MLRLSKPDFDLICTALQESPDHTATPNLTVDQQVTAAIRTIEKMSSFDSKKSTTFLYTTIVYQTRVKPLCLVPGDVSAGNDELCS